MTMSQQLGVEIGVAHTTPKHALGAIYTSPASGVTIGTTYMYLQADGAVTTALFYTYNEVTGQIEDTLEVAVHPADGKTKPLCVSPLTLADNEYAWVVIGPGVFTATSAEALDVDDVLYGHATVGTVADTASACFVPGVTVQTAIGSATTGTFVAHNRMNAYDLP